VLESVEVTDWEGGATRQTTASDQPPKEPRLSLVVYHDGGTLVVPLILHGAITVGRTDAADVIVPEDSLSRRHARFAWSEEGVWIEDLGSTNGTFVGGRKITRALIAPGDDISLGSVIASLHLVDPSSAMQPVVTEEAFEQWLREAIDRSKARERPLALLMVRELGHRQGHLGRWLPRLRAHLRGNEHIGVYGPGWVVLGSESTDYDAAERLAAAIVASPADDGPALGCAVAVGPDAGPSFDELIGVVRELSDLADESQPVQSARTRGIGETVTADGPVVASATMRTLYDTARRVAASNVPVLIYGETGAGKELVARAIHAQSSRAGKPLLTINCGSVPGTLAESVLFGHERGAFTSADRRRIGAFEQASGGTVFLDELSELPLSAQAALLRAIENQRIMRVGSTSELRVDVRILAATNRDLEQLAESGEFRQDLLFRMNAVTLTVPPLRDRVEEIEPLAQHFLELARRGSGARALSLGEAALEKLRRHSWPGNVRELRNSIERAVILAAGPTIEPGDLHVHTPRVEQSSRATLRVEPIPSAKLKDQVRAYEAELIIDALKTHGWNQTEAARALNIPVRTLAHKIQLYGLKGRFPKGG
jgi:DNA-binding NtrC family response regulator